MSKQPVLIALGGVSGVGKTVIIRELQRRFPNDVKFFPAFTTRPQRFEEQEGKDYFFRTEKDLKRARKDPRYFGFVEARGYWYWMDGMALETLLKNYPSCLYLFVLTQRHEVEEYKRIFPNLRYVWLFASEEDIQKRLRNTRKDVEASFAHNRKLQETRVDDLIDLRIDNSQGKFERAVETIVSFWKHLSSS